MNTTTHTARSTATMTFVAAILALVSVAAPAHADGFEVTPPSGRAVVPGYTLSESFTMSMWVEPGTRDGHVAGHPGRVAVVMERGHYVLRVGGQKPIAGIYRDTAEVRVPATDGWNFVVASVGADGQMSLTVRPANGGVMQASGEVDADLVPQLDMMEAVVGGVSCSDNLYVGTSTAECGQAFDGVVESLEVVDAVMAPEDVRSEPGC